MFDLQVLKSSIHFRKKEILVSHSLNIYLVKFKFSPDWDELAKVIYFTDGFETINVLLDEENSCFIPHEVLQTPKREVKVGVRGTFNGKIILPTIWQSLGKVEKGVEDEGAEAQEPTPELIDRILTKTEKVARQAVKLSVEMGAMGTNIKTLVETVNILVDKVNALTDEEEEPLPPIGPVEPAVIVAGIDVATPPDKLEYTVGEVFDPTGMTVTATYTDDSTKEITDYTFTPAGTLTEDDNKVEISYTEEDITVTTTIEIVVEPVIESEVE